MDNPVYNSSSDCSTDAEDEPLTSNFQFDTEKVVAGDYFLVELKTKKGNSVQYIIIIKKVATKELRVHFLKETGARDFALTDEMCIVLKTEVEMKLQSLAIGIPRLAE